VLGPPLQDPLSMLQREECIAKFHPLTLLTSLFMLGRALQLLTTPSLLPFYKVALVAVVASLLEAHPWVVDLPSSPL